MKCPKCSYNQKVKLGMHCRGCKYTFTFNPKETRSFELTDGKFLAAIRSASQNDTAFFTRNQLYGAYCRQRKYPRGWLLFGGGMLLIGALAAMRIDLILTGFLGFFGIMLFLSGAFGKAYTLSRTQFERLIDNWLADHKKISRLIVMPTLHNPPPQWTESDIYDYGVEQILIVQRDELVDLFVLNGAHAERRALVISETGYPQYLMPHAKRMLEERNDLPVYIMHDAGKIGEAMLSRVKKMDLPLEGRKIIDLGMSTSDFKKLKRTANYDRKNRRRELPIDSLATPFLMTGLAACFVGETTMTALLDEQAREAATASATSSFG